MPGWGNAIGWLFDRFPSRKESLINEIRKIKEEMDGLLEKGGHMSVTEYKRYELLADRLREAEEKLTTIHAS